MINRVELIISYNSQQIPFNRVTLLSEKQGVDIFSDEYKHAEDRGLFWSNLISSTIGN